MKTSSRSNQFGSSLAVVMAVLAILVVIVAIAAEYTANINRQVQRSNTLESAVTVGDSCMEILFANWRSICRTDDSTAYPTSAFSSIPLPTTSMFPSLTSMPGFNFGASRTDYYGSGTPNPPTISNFKVVAADPEWKPLASASATPKPIIGPAAVDVGTLTPTTPAFFNYIASADITLPTLKGNVVAKVRRVLQKQRKSPWNFAIYFDDPLEIHPGPQFTVSGWVHTNSDLYTAHDTLTFADKVTYGSSWKIDFMPGDGVHNGQTPASPNYPANLPPAQDQSLQAFNIDPSLFNPNDANPNNDSYHELIEPPISGNPDPLDDSRYYNSAGLVIQVDAANTVTIKKNNFNGSYTTLTSSSSGNDKKLYDMVTGALTTNQSIQDNREAASVRLVTLDVGLMLKSGTYPQPFKGAFNNIIYVQDTSASAGAHRGVRIQNGSVIPQAGLTIASPNPVYVQGDFNTGGTGTAVPSNVVGSYGDPANPPDPQVAGYTRAPASIVADAVNILSNSWDDAKSGMPLGSRLASPTTVNTAIISGIVPTAAVGGDGSYSGGAENFPRFLENWSNDTLTYYGSMVELYKSQQSIGEWGKANVYSPPTREWFFDSTFKTKPPLGPQGLMIYSYIKGKWSLL